MKVYIAQPSNHNYQELEISRAYAIKRIQEFGHEVIDDYVRDETSLERDTQIIYLSEALKKIADADAVYFIDDWEQSNKCRAIYKMCEEYGIKIFDPRIYY